MKRILFTLVALLTLWAVPTSAQTYLTSTTLSTAVTSVSADTVVVASASTVAVGGYLYVNHEAMQVVSISGTSIRVARGQQGTAATTHSASATVIVFPVASLQGALPAFGQRDPAGSCTPGNHRYLPIVNVVSGNVWLCRYVAAGGARQWAATNIVMVNGQTSLLINLQ